MLEPDHPLRPILGRLRLYLSRVPPRDAAQAADQRDYEIVLEDLENGLFDRLPEIVVQAILEHGANLHPSLDAAIVDIAWYVRDGLRPVDRLVISFRARLNRYHGQGAPAADNIVFIGAGPTR